MQWSCRVATALALVAVVAASAAAQVPPVAAKPTPPKSPPFTSVYRDAAGTPVLWIQYPWAVHAKQKLSIEVRLVTSKTVREDELKPTYFVHSYMKGDVVDWVYRCQDHVDDRGYKRTVTKDDIDFEIVGTRNDLGRAAVHVMRPLSSKDPMPGAAAAFLMLSDWAINDKMLYIDLPRAEFAEAGRLYVWLLRDGDTLWREEVAWPGYGPQESK